MKKFFKSVFAVTVAAITSFAVAVFAGCDDEDKASPEPAPAPKYTVTVPEISLTTGNETYDAIISSDFAATSLAGTVSIGGESVTVNAIANSDLSFADFEVYMPEEGYGYAFIRDGAVYATSDTFTGKVTDFTAVELDGITDFNKAAEEYLAAIEESGIELEGAVDGMFSPESLMQNQISEFNYEILSIADAADSAVIDEAQKTVTVDINKTVYNMVNQVKAFINGLTAQTTLGGVLENEVIKSYAQIFTELVTPEDVRTSVSELTSLIGGLGAQLPAEDGEAAAAAALLMNLANNLFTAVEPDENSTTYDYIVKVLGSQQLVNLINSLMQQAGGPSGIGLTKRITEFTLGEIVSLISLISEETITLDDLLDMANAYIDYYTSGITETKLSVSEEGEEVFSLTDASIVYAYGDNGLTAMQFSMDLTVTSEEEGEKQIIADVALTFGGTAYEASSFAALPATLPEITDVDFGGDIYYYDKNAIV